MAHAPKYSAIPSGVAEAWAKTSKTDAVAAAFAEAAKPFVTSAAAADGAGDGNSKGTRPSPHPRGFSL